MQISQSTDDASTDTARYAKCIEVSKRIRWDIDRDVIRDRRFDFGKKFLPDGLSHLNRLAFLNDSERLVLSQIACGSFGGKVRGRRTEAT